MNIGYIRAAIEAETGIRLSLKRTVEYLLSEGMITPKQAEKAIFPGYKTFFVVTSGGEIKIKDDKEKDIVELLETEVVDG